MSETIYQLCVKQLAGLKYLCYTTVEDPYAYCGSGEHWMHHTKKYNGSRITNFKTNGKYNIKTVVLLRTHSLEVARRYGIMLSHKWNVVESKDWANKIIEDLAGAETQKEISSLGGNARKKQDAEEREKYELQYGVKLYRRHDCPRTYNYFKSYIRVHEDIIPSHWKIRVKYSGKDSSIVGIAFMIRDMGFREGDNFAIVFENNEPYWLNKKDYYNRQVDVCNTKRVYTKGSMFEESFQIPYLLNSIRDEWKNSPLNNLSQPQTA